MKSIRIETTVRVGTRDISSEATYEAEGTLDLNPPLPAGNAGELSARTDDNTGVATLSTGHGIQTGDKVDVYWPAGLRYGMDATVSVNDVAVDGGAGDVLPAVTTDLVVTKRVSIVAPLTGNLAVVIVGHSTKRAHIDFLDGAGASLLPLELAANKAWSWANDLGFDNPLAGDTVATIAASCGEAEAADLSVPILYDAVS